MLIIVRDKDLHFGDRKPNQGHKKATKETRTGTRKRTRNKSKTKGNNKMICEKGEWKR